MLVSLGVRMRIPKELRSVVKPRLVSHASRGGDEDGAARAHVSFLAMDDLLQFDWRARALPCLPCVLLWPPWPCPEPSYCTSHAAKLTLP